MNYCTSSRTLRSTNQLLLDCPRFSTEFGKRSFSYLAPTVWNDLPLDTIGSPPPPIPLSAVSRQSSLHSLPVLPTSDCRRLRFSVTVDFCAPYKLLYYYYYYYYFKAVVNYCSDVKLLQSEIVIANHRRRQTEPEAQRRPTVTTSMSFSITARWCLLSGTAKALRPEIVTKLRPVNVQHFADFRRGQWLRSCCAAASDASISLSQFRYDIDTIFTKYRNIDVDIDIKYVGKMHAFCRLKF